jgi:heat shock protein HtpX
MADAGAAQLTKNPMGLANALRKISGNSKMDESHNVASPLFINDDEGMTLFSTHPPIAERIRILESF